MKTLRRLALAAILAAASLAQSIVVPGQSIPVSLTWLYENKMRWAGAWNSTTTYNPQDVVTNGGVGYISLSGGNLNNTPAPGVWWTALPVSSLSLPSGAQTQYLRIQPNSGNLGTYQFAGIGALNVADYNYSVITPVTPATLTGGAGAQTITVAMCPLGIYFSSAWAPIQLTAGSGGQAETVTPTGGTCSAATLGVTGGTIVVAPVQNHGAGFQFFSATSGIQEAVYAAAVITTADQTGGDARPAGMGVRLPDGVSLTYAAVTLPISVSLFGSGVGGSVISEQTNGQNGIVVPGSFATYNLALHDFQIRYQYGLTFPTSGSAIQLNAVVVGEISNVTIATAYNGLELNNTGAGPSISGLNVVAAGACVWAHGFTTGSPGGLVLSNFQLYTTFAGGDYAIRYQGTSAGITVSNGIIGATTGISIVSGAGSPLNEIHIDNVDDDNNVAGGLGLLLEGDGATVSNTAQVSNSRWNATGAGGGGVQIINTTNDNVMLSNNLIAGNGSGGIGVLLSGSKKVTFTGNVIAGPNAIQMQSSPAGGVFSGNYIGYPLYGVTTTNNIATDGTPTNFTFFANSFNPAATMPAVGNWSGTNNFFGLGQTGIPQPAIASASSIALPPYPFFTITGATGVGTVSGCNQGQSGELITTGGAVTFTAGSTIGNTFTSTQNLPVSWFCDAAGKFWASGAGGGTQTVYSGSQALATSLIASTACVLTTVTAAGALATDRLIAQPSSDPTGVTGYQPLTTGNLEIWAWLTSGQINIKQCNPTSSSITPGALSVTLGVYR